MAVAIPLVMGAMGAGTMVTALTSIAFAVTGISAKINEAAASVFGADLVQIGNLFGSVVGATGGFGPIDPAAGAGDYVNSMDAMSDAVTNAGSNGYLANLTDAGNAANAVNYGATDLASQADGIAQMGGDANEFNLSALSDPAKALDPTKTMGAGPDLSKLDDGRPLNLLPTEGAVSAQASGPNASTQVAAGSNAAGTNAASTNAAAPIPGPNALNGSDIMSDTYRGGANGAGGFGANTPAPSSFFGKFGNMLLDKDGKLQPAAIRGGMQLIGGIGQGYMKAQKMKQDQDQFEAKMRMYNQRPNLRSTQ